MKMEGVEIEVPEGMQLILGQAHFIKSVEDLYESLVTSVPGLKFGVAFCEASGKSLVRSDGSDAECVKRAEEVAERIGAGHLFVVFLSGAFPINVLDRVKGVQEVTLVYCATANPVTVVVADTGKGRGVMGVVDGGYLKGREREEDRVQEVAPPFFTSPTVRREL
jgi:uncharacterized protein